MEAGKDRPEKIRRVNEPDDGGDHVVREAWIEDDFEQVGHVFQRDPLRPLQKQISQKLSDALRNVGAIGHCSIHVADTIRATPALEQDMLLRNARCVRRNV